MELGTRNIEQFRALVARQQAHERVGRGTEGLEILGGIIAFIEKQGDILAVAAEQTAPLDEFFGDGGKGLAVVMVAGVRLVEEGHMEIRTR